MTEQAQAIDGIVPEFLVGDRLRRARELTELDRQDFAREIGVARSTVSNVENGITQPSRLVLRAWAMRTGVSFTWLRDGWAPWGSNPQPAGSVDAQVIELRPRSAPQPVGYVSAQVAPLCASA